MAEDSLTEIKSAQSNVTRDKDEFARFVNDNQCIVYFARFYRAKIEAAIAKGLYDAGGDISQYDRMLAKLAESVAEYQKLAELASKNYRQPSDLGEWHNWLSTAKSFEQEAAFYHEQRALHDTGADVVYIGLGGQMDNASNAFHWMLEDNVQQAHWTSQSYALADSPFARAKLVIVYDLASTEYQRNASKLFDWVKSGGKLVLWDVKPATAFPPFLDGIQFQNDSSRDAPTFVGFANETTPLLKDLVGSHQDLDSHCSVTPNIVSLAPDWHELAFTVAPSLNIEQIQWGYGTFGPRWTSTLNSARRPLLVTRKIGAGEILLSELDSCNVLPKAGLTPENQDVAPKYLRNLAHNILQWGQTNATNGVTPPETPGVAH